jgi:hypothetical protein
VALFKILPVFFFDAGVQLQNILNQGVKEGVDVLA